MFLLMYVHVHCVVLHNVAFALIILHVLPGCFTLILLFVGQAAQKKVASPKDTTLGSLRISGEPHRWRFSAPLKMPRRDATS